MLALVLPVLLSTALSVALGQTPTRNRPFPEVRGARRWGPFLVDPGFVIDNIGYDDNIYLVSKDYDKPETDFVVRLGPEVTAQTHFGRRVALTIYDKLSGEVFLRHSNLNHADNDLKTQFDVFLNRVLLTTKVRWWTYRQRPNSEIDERTRRDSRDFRQGIRLFASEKIDFYGEVRANRIRYTDPDYLYRVDPDGDGTWEVTVTLDAGSYAYKFIVDGAWMTDPLKMGVAILALGHLDELPEPLAARLAKAALSGHLADKAGRRLQDSVHPSIQDLILKRPSPEPPPVSE
jgi:hypothetical protein